MLLGILREQKNTLKQRQQCSICFLSIDASIAPKWGWMQMGNGHPHPLHGCWLCQTMCKDRLLSSDFRSKSIPSRSWSSPIERKKGQSEIYKASQIYGRFSCGKLSLLHSHVSWRSFFLIPEKVYYSRLDRPILNQNVKCFWDLSSRGPRVIVLSVGHN